MRWIPIGLCCFASGTAAQVFLLLFSLVGTLYAVACVFVEFNQVALPRSYRAATGRANAGPTPFGKLHRPDTDATH